MSGPTATPPRPQAAGWTWSDTAAATLAAGLTGAVCEMVIVLPVQLALGTPPLTLFQSIAYGALGAPALHGGLATALLGVAIHVFISLVAAALYTAAAVKVPPLLKRPIAGGLACGAAAYMVMVYLVIPLSRIGPQKQHLNGMTLVSLGTHLFAFGLPLALVSSAVLRGAARRRAIAGAIA